MVEEKASSGDPTPSVLLESVLAHCYELWFLNVSLLGNDQTQTADTRILLKDYCGFFRHKNKKKELRYDFHISQNVMSTSLRMKLRTFRAALMFNGEGNGNPLQYSCLENTMDRGALWDTVRGITKSQTRLSD